MKLNESAINSFATLTVKNEHDKLLQLSSLWQETRAVLFFVRHFG